MTPRIEATGHARYATEETEAGSLRSQGTAGAAAPDVMTQVMVELAEFLGEARTSQREQARGRALEAVGEQLAQADALRAQAEATRSAAVASAVMQGASLGLRVAQTGFIAASGGSQPAGTDPFKNHEPAPPDQWLSHAGVVGGAAATFDGAAGTAQALGQAATLEHAAEGARHGAQAARAEGEARQHEELARELRGVQSAMLESWRAIVDAEHAGRRAILKG